MACRLFGAKPLPEPTLTNYRQEHTPVKMSSKYESAFEYVVCEMVTIMYRSQ